MTVLELPGSVREAIVEHARDGAPEEVVGILAGRRAIGGDGTGDRSIVERSYAAENAADAPRTRYEIAPREELELLERIDEAGLDVVGFYHSHPDGPAEPSAADARLAAWPGYAYVIVSLGGDGATVRGWRWTGERFESEPVRSGSGAGSSSGSDAG
jgi:proteasome lid subunit RPN8/RPN11